MAFNSIDYRQVRNLSDAILIEGIVRYIKRLEKHYDVSDFQIYCDLKGEVLRRLGVSQKDILMELERISQKMVRGWESQWTLKEIYQIILDMKK